MATLNDDDDKELPNLAPSTVHGLTMLSRAPLELDEKVLRRHAEPIRHIGETQLSGLQLDSLDIGSDASHERVHDQTQSPFFHKLPLEVRQNIYSQLWLSAGSTQHIFKAGNSRLSELSHATCITDPDAKDPRDDEVARRCQDQIVDDPGDIDAAYEELLDEPGETTDDWVIRLFSDWCNHFRCEEQPEIPQVPPSERLRRQLEESLEDDGKLVQALPARSPAFFFSPFLGPMLTCRRMAAEAQQSLYESITFSFIGTGAMRRFLETTSPDLLAQIRSIHIIWRAPTEAYW